MKLNNRGITIGGVIGIVVLFFFLLIMVSIMVNNLNGELNIGSIETSTKLIQ